MPNAAKKLLIDLDKMRKQTVEDVSEGLHGAILEPLGRALARRFHPKRKQIPKGAKAESRKALAKELARNQDK